MNPLMQSIGAPTARGGLPANLTGALQKAGMLSIAIQAYQAYRAGRLDEFAQKLYQSNPQFRKYADENKGKTLSQIAEGYGVDLDQIIGQFK